MRRKSSGKEGKGKGRRKREGKGRREEEGKGMEEEGKGKGREEKENKKGREKGRIKNRSVGKVSGNFIHPCQKVWHFCFFLPAGPISCSIADQKPGRNTAQGQKTYIAGDALVVIHIDMWRLNFLFIIIRNP